jgi:hypothetical protein
LRIPSGVRMIVTTTARAGVDGQRYAFETGCASKTTSGSSPVLGGTLRHMFCVSFAAIEELGEPSGFGEIRAASGEKDELGALYNEIMAPSAPVTAHQ